ncbi:membrane protein [Kushneria avicenniae]|uniref:Membrane protein n=1 Tax=Kushneria avicenniae TaxID=402385 RepID=A0A1I1I775_9GAMM|nr:YihY/virulence factor BrkB family protein [Kushneria avicenniae]SFC31662.1 membrane protein [Kushneria avicenniae]
MQDTTNKPHANNRGRDSISPLTIPGRGWKDTLLRVKRQVEANHATLIAASIAFYAFLGIFPAIAAFISIWGLAFDPQQVQGQIEMLSSVLPEDAASIIRQQALSVNNNAGTGMSITAVAGLVFTVYSASKGMRGLMAGLNIVYGEKEERGLIKLTLVTWVLTGAMMVMTIVTLGTIALLPPLIAWLPFGDTLSTLLTYIRWPILLLLVISAITILYRYGPDRAPSRVGWLSVGSVTATLLWALGSIGFSIYVRNFSSYNQTYGTIGAVMVLLLWFWLSAFIVLLGAALNCELERQTGEDTTTGKPRPMGKRGAWAADTVARDAHDIGKNAFTEAGRSPEEDVRRE